MPGSNYLFLLRTTPSIENPTRKQAWLFCPRDHSQRQNPAGFSTSFSSRISSYLRFLCFLWSTWKLLPTYLPIQIGYIYIYDIYISIKNTTFYRLYFCYKYLFSRYISIIYLNLRYIYIQIRGIYVLINKQRVISFG